MSNRTPVVFVHGLWVHASAWSPWAALFEREGFDPIVAGWPGNRVTVEETRRDGDAVANRGVDDVVAHYADLIETLSKPPVVVGHSFGGLVAQRLLDEGRAAAAIAIDPAPILGVTALPLSQIRSTLPVLRNRRNRERAVALTERQFRYAIANAIPRLEARDLFDRYAIPAPGRPLFELIRAAKDPQTPLKVNLSNHRRGPLLIIGGGRDHIVAERVTRQAASLHSASRAVTDYHVFPDRGHSMIMDSGWRDVADLVLEWMARHPVSHGRPAQEVEA